MTTSRSMTNMSLTYATWLKKQCRVNQVVHHGNGWIVKQPRPVLVDKVIRQLDIEPKVLATQRTQCPRLSSAFFRTSLAKSIKQMSQQQRVMVKTLRKMAMTMFNLKNCLSRKRSFVKWHRLTCLVSQKATSRTLITWSLSTIVFIRSRLQQLSDQAKELILPKGQVKRLIQPYSTSLLAVLKLLVLEKHPMESQSIQRKSSISLLKT